MRKEKGITLIALVVTIVVLLILAGVSISMLTGENGIITQAQEAKEETSYEGAREKLNLILTDLQAEKIPKGESLILGDELAGEISAYDEVTSARFTGSLIEVVIDGYTFEVNADLGVEKPIEKVEPDNLDDWEYVVEDDGTATLTSYKGKDTTVVIPNYIEGYWVKTIGTNEKNYNEGEMVNTGNFTSLWGKNIVEFTSNYDSWDCSVQNTIKEIIISDGIEKIDAYAFAYSKQLEKVIMPRSITYIGSLAFCIGRYEENDRLKEINIYKNVEELGGVVFNGRDELLINVEYNEDEIPDTWSEGAFLSQFTSRKPTVKYGVSMD